MTASPTARHHKLLHRAGEVHCLSSSFCCSYTAFPRGSAARSLPFLVGSSVQNRSSDVMRFAMIHAFQKTPESLPDARTITSDGCGTVASTDANQPQVLHTSTCKCSDRTCLMPGTSGVTGAPSSSGCRSPLTRWLSFCWRSLFITIDAPTKGGGGCSKMTVLSSTARCQTARILRRGCEHMCEHMCMSV